MKSTIFFAGLTIVIAVQAFSNPAMNVIKENKGRTEKGVKLCAAFYEHKDFKGEFELLFAPDEGIWYSQPTLKLNKAVSSIIQYTGCHLIAFEHKYFKGASVYFEYPYAIFDLRESKRVEKGWDDSISSVFYYRRHPSSR